MRALVPGAMHTRLHCGSKRPGVEQEHFGAPLTCWGEHAIHAFARTRGGHDYVFYNSVSTVIAVVVPYFVVKHPAPCAADCLVLLS